MQPENKGAALVKIYFSLLSILYFRWKGRRERKLSLAWFHPLLPKSKNGLVSPLPCPWLPQETNCEQTFGPVLQRHPENPVRRLEQWRWWWGVQRHRSGNGLTSNRCLFLYQCNDVSQCLKWRNKKKKIKVTHVSTFYSFVSSGPPIVSEEELARLAVITPAKASQYSGSRVKALIQILQHQLDQQELVKEFMVGMQ